MLEFRIQINQNLVVRPTRLFPFLFSIVIAYTIRSIFPAVEPRKSVYTRHFDYFYSKKAPIKFFMYDIHINDTDYLCKNLFCDHPVKKSEAHTFYFEAILHRHFQKGYNIVLNELDADLFYVPIYLGLYNMQKDKCDFDHCIIPHVRSQGPYYDRYGAVDQVFVQMLFSHNNVPLTPLHQRFIAAQTSIGDINWNFSIEFPREMWRYTSMPYSSNFELNTNKDKRQITAFLIGQLTIQAFDKRAKNIRLALKDEMRGLRNMAIIETRRKSHFKAAHLFDIESIMRKTEFCPVPHGDGPSSKRFYDSLRTGCIPIVLTDEFRFPFEETFAKYNNLMAQVPAFEPSMIRYVFGIFNNQKKDSIRRSMLEINKLLTVDEDLDDVNGGILWAWKWMQYFKSCTVSASKRRNLLQSKYFN